MNDGTRPGLANTVPHHLSCICQRCCEARAAEVRRRLEEQRREKRRADAAYIEEHAGRGLVFSLAKKPMPGSVVRLAKRYG